MTGEGLDARGSAGRRSEVGEGVPGRVVAGLPAGALVVTEWAVRLAPPPGQDGVELDVVVELAGPVRVVRTGFARMLRKAPGRDVLRCPPRALRQTANWRALVALWVVGALTDKAATIGRVQGRDGPWLVVLRADHVAWAANPAGSLVSVLTWTAR